MAARALVSFAHYHDTLTQHFRLLTEPLDPSPHQLWLLQIPNFTVALRRELQHQLRNLGGRVTYGQRFQQVDDFNQFVLFETANAVALTQWISSLAPDRQVGTYLPSVDRQALTRYLNTEFYVADTKTLDSWYPLHVQFWDNPDHYAIYDDAGSARVVTTNSDLHLTDYVSQRQAYQLCHQIVDLDGYNYSIAELLYPIIAKDFVFVSQDEKGHVLAYKFNYADKTWFRDGPADAYLIPFLALVSDFFRHLIAHWTAQLDHPVGGNTPVIEWKIKVMNALAEKFCQLTFQKQIVSQMLIVAAHSTMGTAEATIRSFNQTSPWLPIADGKNINVVTGELRDRTREDRMLNFCKVRWEVNEANMNTIARTMRDMASHNKDKLKDIRISCNMCLQGGNMYELVICHLGGGANGKSLIRKLLFAILGSIFMLNADGCLMTSKVNDDPSKHDGKTVAIEGKRLVSFDDSINASAKLNETTFKSWSTRNGSTQIRDLNTRTAEVFFTFLLCLFVNRLPKGLTDDYAIRRRLLVILWESKFVTQAEYELLSEAERTSGRFFLRNDELETELLQPHMLSAFLAYTVIKGGRDFRERIAAEGHPFPLTPDRVQRQDLVITPDIFPEWFKLVTTPAPDSNLAMQALIELYNMDFPTSKLANPKTMADKVRKFNYNVARATGRLHWGSDKTAQSTCVIGFAFSGQRWTETPISPFGPADQAMMAAFATHMA
jgi:hypothetical protein